MMLNDVYRKKILIYALNLLIYAEETPMYISMVSPKETLLWDQLTTVAIVLNIVKEIFCFDLRVIKTSNL